MTNVLRYKADGDRTTGAEILKAFLSHKEIACRHKIPTALVGRIIRAARKDFNYS